MALKVSDLQGQPKDVIIPVGDEKLNVKYNPSKYTPELEDRMRVESAEGWQSMALVSFLHELLIDWDLMETSSKKYPLTKEAMAKLPLTFLSSIVDGLQEDVSPGEAQGNSEGT